MSTALTEIIRLLFKDNSESALLAKDAWAGLAETISSTAPVSSGMSLNLMKGSSWGQLGGRTLRYVNVDGFGDHLLSILPGSGKHT